MAPHFVRTSLLIAVTMALSLLLLATPAFAQEQCFPDCREGFVCNREGSCVSECNPDCDAGQRCLAGECYVKVNEVQDKEAAANRREEPAAAATLKAGTEDRVVVLGAGFIIQYQDYYSYDAIASYGMELSAAFFPSGQVPYFIRPRVLIAFGEDDNYYEPSIDVGYELDWKGERLSG